MVKVELVVEWRRGKQRRGRVILSVEFRVLRMELYTALRYEEDEIGGQIKNLGVAERDTLFPPVRDVSAPINSKKESHYANPSKRTRSHIRENYTITKSNSTPQLDSLPKARRRYSTYTKPASQALPKNEAHLVQDIQPEKVHRETEESALKRMGLPSGSVQLMEESKIMGIIIDINARAGLEGITVRKTHSALAKRVPSKTRKSLRVRSKRSDVKVDRALQFRNHQIAKLKPRLADAQTQPSSVCHREGTFQALTTAEEPSANSAHDLTDRKGFPLSVSNHQPWTTTEDLVKFKSQSDSVSKMTLQNLHPFKSSSSSTQKTNSAQYNGILGLVKQSRGEQGTSPAESQLTRSSHSHISLRTNREMQKIYAGCVANEQNNTIDDAALKYSNQVENTLQPSTVSAPIQRPIVRDGDFNSESVSQPVTTAREHEDMSCHLSQALKKAEEGCTSTLQYSPLTDRVIFDSGGVHLHGMEPPYTQVEPEDEYLVEVSSGDDFNYGLEDDDLLEFLFDEGSKTHPVTRKTDESFISDTKIRPEQKGPAPERRLSLIMETESHDEFGLNESDEEDMLKLPELGGHNPLDFMSAPYHTSSCTDPGSGRVVKDGESHYQAQGRGLDCATNSRRILPSGIEDALQSSDCQAKQQVDTQPIHSSPARPSVTVLGGVSQSKPRKMSLLNPVIDGPDYQPLKTFARPDFPNLVQDRSPVFGLSHQTFLRTCFKIGEMFKEGKKCDSFGQGAIIELFARVLRSWRLPGTTKQKFVFVDLWRHNPPFPEGILMNYKTTGLADTESKVFVEAGEYKMARCLGRLKRDLDNTTGWLIHIINIRETDWEEIRYTKTIVSAGGIKFEMN